MQKTSVLSRIIKIICSAAAIFLYYWFVLPPLNPRSQDFWIFLIVSVIFCLAIHAFTDIVKWLRDMSQKKVTKVTFFAHGAGKGVGAGKICLLVIGGVIVLMILATVIGSPVFFADKYRSLITVDAREKTDFAHDVDKITMENIPVVDRDTASRLGKRKLGEMSDLVSQFEIEEDYTQVNYQGSPYRVTPLAYGDAIKWLNNQKEGLPAYITVNMVTQEAELVRLEDGMKYSPSEYFMRNIYRYLRFRYPTAIFDRISFEINEEGTPYWVAPTISYRIALWSGRDIDGVVLVNAVTGEAKHYALTDIPTWVDQVFISELVIDQLNDYGEYQGGFWNSIFGQRGVLNTTEGYNYIAMDDDVYLYTGMTSVAGDESNVGFVLVNLRTKETRYYPVPGAEEYSAMDSAQGQVQHLGYRATFPLLLNVADRPTYFMSLKDAAGLVKMYAFVDVERYQVVGTGGTINEARTDYMSKLGSEIGGAIPDDTPQVETLKASGILAQIYPVVVNGNTVYYFTLEDDETIYTADISISARLPFLTAGMLLDVEYTAGESTASVTRLEASPAPGADSGAEA